MAVAYTNVTQEDWVMADVVEPEPPAPEPEPDPAVLEALHDREDPVEETEGEDGD